MSLAPAVRRILATATVAVSLAGLSVGTSVTASANLAGGRHHGPSLNGPSLNGPSLNGPSLNGPSLNGPSLNGPSLN